MNDIILVGGGGHGISCIDVIEDAGVFHICGVLDVSDNVGNKILGYPILGTDDHIPHYCRLGVKFCLSIGQVASGETLKKKVFGILKETGAELPVIISPSARVSRHAKIGEGSVIFTGAVVNAGAIIGKNCIINSCALIEHGATVGNHTHISTGAIVNGDCTVSDCCFVGSGAVLRNGIIVGSSNTIGMGAVVTKNVREQGVYIGNPARKRRI